jgi:hypothetical protein
MHGLATLLSIRAGACFSTSMLQHGPSTGLSEVDVLPKGVLFHGVVALAKGDGHHSTASFDLFFTEWIDDATRNKTQRVR